MRHPALRRPISTERFLREFAALWEMARVRARPRPTVVFDARLAETHRCNARRYAEVDVARRIFYFAPQVLWLPAANRLGLLSHEIGHVIMGEGSHREADADCAAFDDLDIVVEYDRRWPGKGLQRGRRIR